MKHYAYLAVSEKTLDTLNIPVAYFANCYLNLNNLWKFLCLFPEPYFFSRQ